MSEDRTVEDVERRRMGLPRRLTENGISQNRDTRSLQEKFEEVDRAVQQQREVRPIAEDGLDEDELREQMHLRRRR
jgi:hypothetical protein